MLLSKIGVKNTSLFLGHLVAWFIYALGIYLRNAPHMPQLTFGYLVALLFLLSLVFYTLLAVLLSTYRSKKVLRGVTYLLLSYLALAILGYLFIYVLFPMINLRLFSTHAHFSWRVYGWDIGLVLLHFTCYASLYFFVRLAMLKFRACMLANKRKQELIHAQRQQELLFLNSQISTHFIGNSIQDWYVTLRDVNRELSERFFKWAKLMRYNLERGKHRHIKLVRLELELQQLQIMMDVYFQDRCWNTEDVLHLCGDLDGFYIPPYTLLSLFENMIKHGVMNNPQFQPGFSLETSRTGYTVKTWNRIAERPGHEFSCHIGLSNLEKRLSLLMKDHAEFTYALSDKCFRLTLAVKY